MKKLKIFYVKKILNSKILLVERVHLIHIVLQKDTQKFQLKKRETAYYYYYFKDKIEQII